MPRFVESLEAFEQDTAVLGRECRTRPPSLTTLLRMKGSQSGAESKPPMSCHTRSGSAGIWMEAEVLDMMSSPQ